MIESTRSASTTETMELPVPLTDVVGCCCCSPHSHDSRRDVMGKSTLSGLESVTTTPIGSPAYRSWTFKSDSGEWKACSDTEKRAAAADATADAEAPVSDDDDVDEIIVVEEEEEEEEEELLPGPTPNRAIDELNNFAAIGPDGTRTECASMSIPSSTSASCRGSSRIADDE